MTKLKLTTKTAIALYSMLAVVLSGCNSNCKPVPKTQDQIKKDSIEYWNTLHRIGGVI